MQRSPLLLRARPHYPAIASQTTPILHTHTHNMEASQAIQRLNWGLAGAFSRWRQAKGEVEPATLAAWQATERLAPLFLHAERGCPMPPPGGVGQEHGGEAAWRLVSMCVRYLQTLTQEAHIGFLASRFFAEDAQRVVMLKTLVQLRAAVAVAGHQQRQEEQSDSVPDIADIAPGLNPSHGAGPAGPSSRSRSRPRAGPSAHYGGAGAGRVPVAIEVHAAGKLVFSGHTRAEVKQWLQANMADALGNPAAANISIRERLLDVGTLGGSAGGDFGGDQPGVVPAGVAP